MQGFCTERIRRIAFSVLSGLSLFSPSGPAAARKWDTRVGRKKRTSYGSLDTPAVAIV